MSPTRFRCANSLDSPTNSESSETKNPKKRGKKHKKPLKTCGGSGYRSRFSTLRRLYATMYNNPPPTLYTTRGHHKVDAHCAQKTKWRIRVSIPVLNLAKVVCYHVQQSPCVHPSGLEPEPTPWKGVILPLY